jgi:hypothetical protein
MSEHPLPAEEGAELCPSEYITREGWFACYRRIHHNPPHCDYSPSTGYVEWIDEE